MAINLNLRYTECKDVFTRKCMDCDKCYGYKFDGYSHTCTECDPKCLIIKDKSVLETHGLCDECFKKRRSLHK